MAGDTLDVLPEVARRIEEGRSGESAERQEPKASGVRPLTQEEET